MEPITTIGLIATLIVHLKTIRDRDREHVEKTLIAISKAAGETEKYETLREKRKGKRDIGVEHDLARYWTEASYLVEKHDEELGKRLRTKGEYWLSPDIWSPGKISAARIGLKQVKEDADKLLS